MRPVSVLSGHIVIDASVARSVGDPALHPTAVACLRLVRLLERKECATGALMTPALHDEWRVHASRLMTSWLASMESRGRVRREPDRPVRDLRNAVAAVGDEGIRAALEKDIHLSESAILNGLPVASRDDRQKSFLRDLAHGYPAAGRIQWLNPVSDDREDWEPWIEAGCTDRAVFAIAAGGGD